MLTVLRKFLKYGVAGGSALVFDFSLLYILLMYTDTHYLIVVPVVFICATSINYTINRVWVFKSAKQKLRSGYISFLMIAIIGVLLTMGLMYMMVERWHTPVLWARIIAAGLVYIWSFSANFIFTFKEKQTVIK